MKLIYLAIILILASLKYADAEYEAVLYQHCMDQKQFQTKSDEALKKCTDENMDDIPSCMMVAFGYADDNGFVADAEQFAHNILPLYKLKFHRAVNDTIDECWKGYPVKYQDFKNCLDPILSEKCYKWVELNGGHISESEDETT